MTKEKPYYSLSEYFKNTYGCKCYKIAVDAGMTCPNRDGTLDSRGCIFCADGSGEFAVRMRQPWAAGDDASGAARKTPPAGDDAPGTARMLPAAGDDALADAGMATEGDASAAGCGARMPGGAASVQQQIAEGRARMHKNTGDKFVIYFQAYTNTYAPVAYLRQIYEAALDEKDVIGISIATRPDALGEDVLALLGELREKYAHIAEQTQGKFIWVELGLQTIHEDTAAYIRRGYPLPVYEAAVRGLADQGIPYITHIILGLPGESREQMLETVAYVSRGVEILSDSAVTQRPDCMTPSIGDVHTHDDPPSLPSAYIQPFGVKLQLLHVLRGTDLATDYLAGRFDVLTEDAYIDLVIDCIRYLDPSIVLHRVTGDGPKRILIAPTWSGDKKRVLNHLHKRLRELDAMQGDYL